MAFSPIKLPKRPYTTFAEFHLAKERDGDLHHKTRLRAAYPCQRCRGYGKHYRPEDRDPYEGYKMASMYPYEVCGGSGDVGRIAMKALYSKEIQDWKERYDKLKPKHDEQVAILRKAKRLLTQKELRILEAMA